MDTNVFFIFVISAVNCFNIDTKYPIIYFYNNELVNTNKFNSYFGYSVILHESNNSSKSWIQIGAPKANDPNNNFIKSGSVHRCPIGKLCNVFPVDSQVKNSKIVKWGQQQYEINKDNAWIGGSMDIDSKHNRVVICGHRWTDNKTFPIPYTNRISGICYWSFIADNYTNDLLPLIDKSKWNLDQVYYYPLGQAGMSVHIPGSNEAQLVIGAPGIYNWKGLVLKYVDREEENHSNLIQNKEYYKLVIPDNQKLKGIASFSYFGYAIYSGRFFSPNKLLYVSGAPRASRLKGSIIIFDFPKRTDDVIVKLEERQGNTMGEYFGAAIAVADINGDNLDDIIVGAPRYTNKMDEGRIYIFSGSKTGHLRSNDDNIIDGEAIGGQFGLAIQSLGDLDLDGCDDIVIGAPYENENHGVIYIYNGRKKGFPLKLSQRIEGKSLFPGLKGFGISFSKPADIDNNFISDFAVGSYLSQNAILLRSRPVITLKTFIPQSSQDFKLETTTNIFNIEVCLSYDGKYAPKSLDVTRNIKIDENHQRAYIHPNSLKRSESINIKLFVQQQNCKNITFGLKATTNIIDPIRITVSQNILQLDNLNKNTSSQPILVLNEIQNNSDKFCKTCPVVKMIGSIKDIILDIPFILNCGSDEMCETDLIVDAKFLRLKSENNFIIGSQSYISLEISIYNKKEFAYLTELEVTLPENVYLQEVPTNCFEDKKNIALITCEVDNPLQTNVTKVMKLNFDMSKITNSSQKILPFEIFAKSQSNELNVEDNYFRIDLNLITNASINIKGNPETDIYYYSPDSKLINATHFYKVQKSGVSPLNYFQLAINIPVLIETKNGLEQFLSIYQPIGVQGNQPFLCSWEDIYLKEKSKQENIENGEMIEELQRNKRSLLQNATASNANDSFILPIDNKVAFINCSTSNIICKNLRCEVGPFIKSLKVSSLQIRLVLNLSVLEEYVLVSNKDIIYLSTDGNIKEIDGKRYTYTRVSNIFLKEPPPKKVEYWIIIISVIAGILILLLIILGLVKAGFFRRKKLEELEALKQQEDNLDPKKPTSICFLDWQLTHVGPPVLDIFYFIYACSDQPLREQHFDQLIKDYYEVLRERTAEFGSDIEKLYPFSVLQEQLQKFGRYGMSIGIMLLQFILNDPDEIPDMNTVFDEVEPEKIMEKFGVMTKNKDIFTSRMRGVILHCVEKNYI